MATIRNLVIEQNSTFSSEVTCKNLDGTPVDLTTYKLYAQIRKSYYASVSISLNPVATDPTNGILTISLPLWQSESLRSGRYVYDVVIIDSSGVALRVLEGIVIVTAGVTQITTTTTTTTVGP